MRISVIGLGKLGSPMAAVYAAKGHDVVGVDLNPAFVAALNQGRAPVEEPRLQEMIDLGCPRLSATTDFSEAIKATDLSCVIVPTPSTETGAFTNKYLLSALKAMGPGLRDKSGYHVVVITSTVMPGSCDGEIRAQLEQASGRRVGIDIGLCYSPEFIALGSVVNNLLRPDMVLVGESDPRAGDALAQLYLSSCDNSPAIRRMNLVNAEITKISVNTYVTTKISYANMLSDLCERLPGADVDVVTDAVGLDSRIGGKYLKGATGYGGPCFPRDNIAFSVLARSVGAQPLLAEATDAVNNLQVERLGGKVRALLPAGGRVAILGMSYKPDTAVIEESHGVKLAAHLLAAGYSVVIHDPQAAGAACSVLGNRVGAAERAEDAVAQADLVVVMTNWPAFVAIDAQAFRRADGRSLAVIDCWRILPAEAVELCDLHYPGRGPAVEAAVGDLGREARG
ncbi:UDP-glucose dehydrogenase family protein [Magnetospirillum gryphiswaldense]|uniref:UDP-glucose 6-dehydrogenase n=1 Tax=Magnetospirillum gryphiswaldense TaxID=55518 RepID=A4TV71_9PROT|nr:nucleotide sugar dehydrogenase [Magnetospirillum gryphiswaldense]AVM76363.1 GDP-mannose 6-dehydrogenase [Magnetospirillum gryphiswaldense MSR-1]AVM80266.1 GDP-mannose 6-dehydrogenase [Magnetospirillum gryphiswaldense]CAM74528.1 UDP-glucose/GDP-mannose dehydrogenase [Magnetospirillum gryphiswaldense MSR-1]